MRKKDKFAAEWRAFDRDILRLHSQRDAERLLQVESGMRKDNLLDLILFGFLFGLLGFCLTIAALA